MENRKLKPHCLNLPCGTIEEIKKNHNHNASEFIRHAVSSAMSGSDSVQTYWAGYNAAISEMRDAIKKIELKEKI